MSGEVLLVMDLFMTPAYLFSMPAFQRPYDWEAEDAAKMLDDFLACIPPGVADVGELEVYLLGSINLSADGPPVARDQRKKHVVDGQQRIVTLSLLFGAARSCFLAAGDEKYTELADQIKKLLLQEGNVLLKKPEQPRVQLQREDDTRFLMRLLLDSEFQLSSGDDLQLQGESQPKLWANMQLYREAMSGMDLAALDTLVQFVLQRVSLTVTTSSDISTALKFFSVSAQRGRQLQPIDVLKGTCFALDVMPLDRQDEYGQRWSDLERQTLSSDADTLGRDGISRVCQHLATIHTKKAKGSGNEFEDLQRLFTCLTARSAAAAAGAAGPAFFDTVLLPYAQLYVRLLVGGWSASHFSSSSGGRIPAASAQQAERICYLLTCLDRLRPTKANADPPEWEPLVLAALMQHQLGRLRPPALLELLEDLERLSWHWALCRTSKANRAKRVLQALQQLGLAGAEDTSSNGSNAEQLQQAAAQQLVPLISSERCLALKLSADEAAAMLEALDGPVYKTLKARDAIALLVRMNEHTMERLGATYMRPYDASDKNLTLEHILPQNPAAGSDWHAAFSGEEAAQWLHRLGNLALLHGKRNSKASNKSFREKREHYLGPLKQYGTTAIPLTDAVTQLERWDAAAAKARQRELLQLAIDCWRLYARTAAGPAAAGQQQPATAT